MHVAKVPAAAATDPSLSHGALRALILLASHASPAGVAFPSQAKLAQRLGTSRRTIRGYLEELEQRELIAVDRNTPGENLGQTSYRYRIVVRGKHERPPTSRDLWAGADGVVGGAPFSKRSRSGPKGPEEWWRLWLEKLRPDFGRNTEEVIRRLQGEGVDPALAAMQAYARELYPQLLVGVQARMTVGGS